eukprot:TRINITY_DN7085_c0_g1_i2.p1 TRINITY_DN7085_c0_g1~~TRINITY_DN7085_c0_g1_i2.p1  ORF type:complete len:352 (-),score=66.25 TRINITY_DN7085_c0_g1_i2:126-1181(-)
MSAEELGNELMKAVQEDNLERVKELIESGANPRFQYRKEGVWGEHVQKSVIHTALENYEVNAIPIIKLLLDKGVDVNSVSSESNWKGSGVKNTAFDMALERALNLDDSELLELFLKRGGDPNKEIVEEMHTMRTDGREIKSSIHAAAAKENPVFLRLLLENGAKTDAIHKEKMDNERGSREDRTETALHIACESELIANVALLLRYGANVNAERKWLSNVHIEVNSPTDNPRDSAFISSVRIEPVIEYPIHIALKHQNEGLVALLSSFGADTSSIFQYGDSSSTCVELCSENKGLLTALRKGWNPSIHQFYPQEVKDAIRTFLLCVKHLRIDNSVFPRDSQMDICRYIANR